MSRREHHCRVCGGPALKRRRFNTKEHVKGYLRVWLCDSDLEKAKDLTELSQLDSIETRKPIDDAFWAIIDEPFHEKWWYPYVYGGLSGVALQKKRARRYERRKSKNQ